MSMQDPVADMLTRIRNGQMIGKLIVNMPKSKLKTAVADVLVSEGYIDSFNVVEQGSKEILSIKLRYLDGKPVIREINRVSRPGLRQYFPKNLVPKVKNGLGVAVMSTSGGVMSDRKARKLGIGGELLCKVF